MEHETSVYVDVHSCNVLPRDETRLPQLLEEMTVIKGSKFHLGKILCKEMT